MHLYLNSAGLSSQSSRNMLTLPPPPACQRSCTWSQPSGSLASGWPPESQDLIWVGSGCDQSAEKGKRPLKASMSTWSKLHLKRGFVFVGSAHGPQLLQGKHVKTSIRAYRSCGSEAWLHQCQVPATLGELRALSQLTAGTTASN